METSLSVGSEALTTWIAPTPNPAARQTESVLTVGMVNQKGNG